MSILSDLIHKRITFTQAATEIGSWFKNDISHLDPTVQADIASAVSKAKQAASNAVQLADTWVAPHLADATNAVEAAADALLLKATAGVAAPAIPLVNDGLSLLGQALKDQIDVSVAKARGALVTPTANVQQ